MGKRGGANNGHAWVSPLSEGRTQFYVPTKLKEVLRKIAYKIDSVGVAADPVISFTETDTEILIRISKN